jgi:TonB-dependent SusC/RagA subfamily outer membrane receptor
MINPGKMRSILVILLFTFIFSTITASGQKIRKITVSGYVMDLNHSPVPGVMILINGKNTGIVTNNRGFYKLKVDPDAAMISVFTPSGGVIDSLFSGNKALNFTIATSEKILQSPLKTVSEEEVNIGYGSQKKKDLTTPVGSVDNRKNKYSTYTNIFDMLRTVPGIRVNGTSITIQGPSSVNLSTEPLFVVDGAVVSRIDDIRPIEVQSIEVLKGSSAGIYGSRGANGVILIMLVNK